MKHACKTHELHESTVIWRYEHKYMVLIEAYGYGLIMCVKNKCTTYNINNFNNKKSYVQDRSLQIAYGLLPYDLRIPRYRSPSMPFAMYLSLPKIFDIS